MFVSDDRRRLDCVYFQRPIMSISFVKTLCLFVAVLSSPTTPENIDGRLEG